MTRPERIMAFTLLGNKIDSLLAGEHSEFLHRAKAHSGWFTDENVIKALKGIRSWLYEDDLTAWLKEYPEPQYPKKIGVVMAGNIPLVGFHDFLSVLISGHMLEAKLSSQDPYTITFLAEALTEVAPAFNDYIQFADRLNQADAFIATGSDNTARYFHQYFGKKPNIIRKNRSSCAVLNGDETITDFKLIGEDIFNYYGLGCRNVSKLFVPKDYNFSPFLDALQSFEAVGDHHKYRNNYDYNKSIYLVNRMQHLDNGFLLLKEDNAFVSPISMLFYEQYENLEAVAHTITAQNDKIQCIVGTENSFFNTVTPGESQTPGLRDYADNVDTLSFLSTL